MDIVVLGASGRCGSWATRLASQRGHDVTAVVRPSSLYSPPPGVRVRRGEATDPAFLGSALRGQSVILSCLGLRRDTISPWSRLRSPPDLVQRVTGLLLGTVDQDARVIWISAGGVGASERLTDWAVRRLIGSGSVRVAYEDLNAAEGMVKAAGRPWIAVRPVTLVPGGPKAHVGQVRRYGLFSTIRRGDVAKWMLDVADGSRPWRDDSVLLGSLPATSGPTVPRAGIRATPCSVEKL